MALPRIKYQPLPAATYIENRARFVGQMEPGSVAIFHSSDQYPRSGDQGFTFRQNADLLWLTGIDQEETMLVLFPGCPKGKAFEEVLFVRETSEHIRVWEGYKFTQAEASEISGVQTVKWTSDSAALLHELVLLAENVYIDTNENDRAAFEVPERNERKAWEMRQRYPGHRFLRAASILKRLRMIKSPAEVAAIRHACNITESAFRRVLAFAKPGKMEYEVEAEIIHEFIRQGSNGHAYNPIIAGGANACVLHYNDNNRPLVAGEVLLMDFGADYANYAADLSRSIPIGGRFAPRQRAVYDAVLRVMKFAKSLLRPGTSLPEYHLEVGRAMEGELIGLGLLDREAVAKQNPDAPLYKKYFMHGTSHHLGLDVHDIMLRYTTFEAGMVLTCEPGIYIPEEGIGIRLENDILLTEGDPIDLMAGIPLEADEIEELMNAR